MRFIIIIITSIELRHENKFWEQPIHIVVPFYNQIFEPVACEMGINRKNITGGVRAWYYPNLKVGY